MVAAIRILALILASCTLSGQMLKVRLAGSGVTKTPMEEYVAWVLAGEAGGHTSTEGLKATAIVIRTYARYNLGRHAKQGYDFCETTHCQDARPKAVTAQLRAAAAATEGIILWYNGKPAQVFYTGHCGGRTAAAGEIWPRAARPYLRGVEDSYCLSAGRAAWTAKIAWSDLSRALGLSDLHEVDVERRTGSGRAGVLRTNAGVLDAERVHLAVGRMLGWQLLRSRLYDVRGDAGHIVFSGSGNGHGVGFCQTGADQRGKAGQSWPEIIEAYMPGLRAGVSARDIPWRVMQGERVEAWGTGAPGDEQLSTLADRALAEAERRSTLHVTKRPQVRAYPSIAVFRDATGESGATAAVARGRVVHMQPVARLRAAATLDSTLLHEMLHVVIGLNAKRPLPLWFDEGLADYLGGGKTHPAERARVAALVKQRGVAAVIAMSVSGRIE